MEKVMNNAQGNAAQENAINKAFYFRHGFKEDIDNEVLSKIIAAHGKFKEVNFTISVAEPNMILSRVDEKGVTAVIDSILEERLILKRSDKSKTVILNIPMEEITDSLVKQYGNKLYEFQFMIGGCRYGLSLFV